jgi:rubrerythrin
MKKWVCSICGYVFEGETPPEKCPSANLRRKNSMKQIPKLN